MAKRLPSGHGVAYLGMVLGLAASVSGNVANTVLTPSAVHDGLRIPFAVAWPILTYIGIEVLTRVEWERNWKHWGARAMLLGPMATVSAFMSYLHLHHLMIMSGEPGLAQAVGPLAIDGTLFGCTVALLVTRASVRQGVELAPKVSLAQRVADMRATAQAVAAAAKGADATAISATDQILADTKAIVDAVDTQADDPTPTSSAPVSPAAPKLGRQSTLRNGWDVAKAVRCIMDTDMTNTEIGDLVGINYKMIQRARRAVEALKADPTAAINPDWKVPAAVLDVARREVRALS